MPSFELGACEDVRDDVSGFGRVVEEGPEEPDGTYGSDERDDCSFAAKCLRWRPLFLLLMVFPMASRCGSAH